MRLFLVILLSSGAVAATASAAGGDREQLRADFAHNRAIWTGQHLRDYRFRLRVRCFCPGAGHPVTITVRAGRPRGATGFLKQLDTVPDLLREVGSALDDPRAGDVVVRYDARRGFPRTASIDRIKNAVDDEIGWTIDRFRPLRAR